MTLINRVARLFRADVHALLDGVEEPGLLLRQALREMEEALGRDRGHLGLLARERRALDGRRGELEASLAALEGELDVCFEAGRDELARETVRRRLEGERLLGLLVRRQEELGRETAEVQERLSRNGDRLAGMRRQAELLDAEQGGEVRGAPWSGADARVADSEVEVAFLRERQRRAGR